jgi:uncharacterized protein YkwD
MAITAGLAAASPAAASRAHRASACVGADVLPANTQPAAVTSTTLCLLNVQRSLHGLRPLHAQPKLAAAATAFSQQMVQQGFFNHVSPSGSTLTTRIDKTHYTAGARSWSLGENIAWGAGSQATPGQIVNAWMHSAGHKANILNGTFKEIGIGVAAGAPVATGSSPAATYTTDFGSRG